MYQKSIFIFRRDLRLNDNTGLQKALSESKEVIPIFIFDPRQLKKHAFRSDFGLQFMLESLQDLNQALIKKGSSLYCFEGQPEEVIRELVTSVKAEAVYCNQDYTPFSIKRDKSIASTCSKAAIDFHATHDALLQAPGAVVKDDGLPYKVYTPFMKRSIKIPPAEVKNNRAKNYFSGKIKNSNSELLEKWLDPNFKSLVKGGRSAALKILKGVANFSNYDEERNLPAVKGTTTLSAHFKFGTVSAREAFEVFKEAFGLGCTLIRELYWRDFLTHIGFHFPHVFQGAFRKKYDAIVWENDKKKFQRWCDGETGFPIVDAGMRELNETGFMHNRVRMITASFLVKDLLIDWKWGEKYFATKLVDYDPAVNNGNWQWASSTGCDAQPYFRIFNPWLQQKRFDKDCVYIKKWIPELQDLSPKEIHKLADGVNLFIGDYEAPVVTHKEQTPKAKLLFVEANEKDAKKKV